MSANDANSVVQCYGSEPLYLLAEENNKVYVDNFLLEQHQIDGLRFLFNQFNKKSPGVIVNFPPSCGKSATVAIFLNAVTNVLKNPVLILCKDDSALQYWKEILLKWSSYVEDHIAVEASNPFIKGKKVFLKKRENLYSYLRRRWSIIIIKENIVSKDVFKLAFEADFKMCITATDIKKDASLLTAVYNWLYPKSKVNINDFVAKENHPREKFRKSVQLDLILEDVAIRRYLNLKPFHTERADNVTEIETNLTEDETNHRKGPSKNKDATGTKVKRSKITAKDGLVVSTPPNQNDEVINKLSGQAFIFINDFDKTSDLNVNLNSILMNDQLTNNTSDQNIILLNNQIVNDTSHENFIFTNDQAINETSNQNVIFIDEQVLKSISNQNFILMNDQIVNEPSDQNVILIDEQVLSETLNQTATLTHNQISNRNSNQNTILKENQIVNKPDQNDILIDEQVQSKILNQNATLTNNHISNRNSYQNIILKEAQIVKEPSDQNVILIDEQVPSETLNQNATLTNNHISNRNSNQNIILKDTPIVKEPSDQNVILIDEQVPSETLNQNATLTNNHISNRNYNQNIILKDIPIVKEPSDQNVILIDEQVPSETLNQNATLTSDHISNRNSNQNIILKDTPIVKEPSDQNVILIDEQVPSETLNQNATLTNNHISNRNYNQNLILKDAPIVKEPSDQNVILIDKQVLSETLNQTPTLTNLNKSNRSSNQNIISKDDQIGYELSVQNDILIDKRVLSETLNQNATLTNNHTISNRNSYQNIFLKEAQIVKESDQNVSLIDEQVISETLNQNPTLTNHHKSKRISNQTPILTDKQLLLNYLSNKNVVSTNCHLDVVANTSDQNVILIDERVQSETLNQNATLTNNHIISSGNSYQNIFLKEAQIVKESDQNVSLIDEQVLSETLNQNPTLTNHHKSNIISNHTPILTDKQLLLNYLSNKKVVSTNGHINIVANTSDKKVILNDRNKNESNARIHIKDNDVRNKIRVYAGPMINKKNNLDKDNMKGNRVKLSSHKSLINSVINNSDTSDDQDSFKLDVDNFIRDQRPLELVSRYNKLSRLYHKTELNINTIEKTLKLKKIDFNTSLNINNVSKVNRNEINDLDDKDLLKEQLIDSLHLDNSQIKEEIKDSEETFIKEESTESLNFENNSKLDLNEMKKEQLIESLDLDNSQVKEETKDSDETFIKEEPTESLNFENNSKLDLNEMKDLKKQLIESLGFDSDSKVIRNESKNTSKVDLNEMKDIRNKCLLQKQLIASLGLNSDCEEIKKTINENNNELNECIDFDKTLIKEESTESLSLGSNSIVDQNEIRNDINILKEKPAESLNLCTNSKVDQNEMKDLHNKTVLQKQLIESLGLDDVKPEIKDEENDDQNNISKNIQNAVQQIATDPEDDGIIKIKIESEDGNETNTERSVNNVSNKRKSDKDLDCKILDMEEKALKKFKGSFLDSIF
ncbi:MATH and LRR domain-containing protein PFE0570w-like isoform X1 [Maniola jurtina]|uniref:MATH and LRR domain-containing protein PFE0570w-like isoform X1 n=1 Tax=Maniola jurtina TaxID=191418 RepID=UPI001E68BB67|nr:MATH and LRR domain-containing protein PFE0570w-like isoform X1 [Maniola jurtina]XP_045771508.1 MATH and LRR domain-containing protein PFE0570w-like isoform X1 [Maniola jurtina]XP_045771509.1 MATH and LRR domain-containing protein PFE0570w-like isoform X1 [Maniola jurtina]